RLVAAHPRGRGAACEPRGRLADPRLDAHPPAANATAHPRRRAGRPARRGRARGAEAGARDLPGPGHRHPGGVIFGSVLGVLVFAYLVARCLLFLTAWAATAPVDREPAP